MASIQCLNPKAELARHAAALELNISGARGLQEIMRTNLGPKGTMKMLVSSAGDIKLTKDGNVLLHEMVFLSTLFLYFMYCLHDSNNALKKRFWIFSIFVLIKFELYRALAPVAMFRCILCS
uniref:Chaperonin Cpn60/TCP-1 n=1 Tax=Ascaris lumbricoides TaxID=6252 RepID=A0A0M3ILK5_ASCLU